MSWPTIEKVRQWTSKRKSLLTGLVAACVEETVNLVPGGRLAVRIVGELTKHGVERLAQPAAVPEVKAAGEIYTREQLDQLNAYLENLSTSYDGLLDRLEALDLATDDQSDEQAVVLIRQALAGHQDLAEQFEACARQVRMQTLSLARIEEQLGELFHEQLRVNVGLEDIKAILADSPMIADWEEFRRARPEAVQALNRADEFFLMGDREQGARELLKLMQQRGVGDPTLCRALGVRAFAAGRLEQAQECLDLSARAVVQAPVRGRKTMLATSNTLARLATADSRGGLPAWRSLPRFFVVERRYRIEAEVGRGGMASVYRASWIDLVHQGEVVALKVPSADLLTDETARQRFINEIRVSRRLSGQHPNIVQTLGYAIFEDPHTRRESYGLVMEYIEGVTLAQFLAQRKMRDKPLSPEDVLRLLRPVCEAVACAHKLGVFHRDLKPHNVMLTNRSGRTEVKLMDFGIARVLADSRDSRRVRTQLVGTPTYMPPDREFDARSDVYLAGILLLEMLTFDPLGEAKGRKDCPGAWAKLIGDATHRYKDERPQTMEEFLRHLEEGLRLSPPPKPSLPSSVPAVVERPASPGQARLRRSYRVLPEAVTNSVGMKLAWIPAGHFPMGSPECEVERSDDESPQHEVVITRPFLLGVYPVTQREYQEVMSRNPSYFSRRGGGKDKVSGLDTSDFPVEQVSWEDAAEFCRRLSERLEEQSAGRVYRLPTEAEWEYACRGGASEYQVFHIGHSLSSQHANFNGRWPYGWPVDAQHYLARTSKVGLYAPNGFGLYDLHGNIWEWCFDWYDAEYYAESPKKDPPGPSEGSLRVVRGGCWSSYGRYCRSASRLKFNPANRRDDLGFRVVSVSSGR